MSERLLGAVERPEKAKAKMLDDDEIEAMLAKKDEESEEEQEEDQ